MDPGSLRGGMQHGVNGATTVNASAEILQDQLTARGGAAYRLTRHITLNLTPAVSLRAR